MYAFFDAARAPEAPKVFGSLGDRRGFLSPCCSDLGDLIDFSLQGWAKVLILVGLLFAPP